jgi:hypothetical protein
MRGVAGHIVSKKIIFLCFANEEVLHDGVYREAATFPLQQIPGD